MRTAAAFLLSFLIASTALAAAPGQAGEPLAWTAVVPSAGASVGSVQRSVASHDVGVRAVPPAVRLPSNPPIAADIHSPGTRVRNVGRTVVGIASWYCRPGISRCTAGYPADCLCAAAGPALRVGNWRGRIVVVHLPANPPAGSRSVRVRLVDCNCGVRANLIDLYASAFQRLAPLSRGRLNVSVTW